MKVGFTGTHLGMTKSQQEDFYGWLYELGATELHHGDCIGADNQADGIARRFNCKIIVHPPTDPRKRAFVPTAHDVFVHDPYPYLTRNKHIVEACEVLLACPASNTEIMRSGTWSTIRYARKIGRTHHIIFP